jgi:Rrf2 family protein
MVRSEQAARDCGVARLVLSKVLTRLAADGLLHSCRDKGGGYRLARMPSEITLLEVVQAVEGPVGGYNPLARGRDGPLDRRVERVCGRAAEAARAELSKVRLSDLIAP